MRNTQRWRNQWTSALKSQLSLETQFPPVASLWRAISPSFPRSVIPNIEDWKTSQTFKYETWHHANRLRAINFILSFHLPLCLSILHTRRRLSRPSAVFIWSRSAQTDLCQVFLDSPDSSGWFWCDVMWWDEMLSSSLLQLFQMRLSLLGDCRASSGARHCLTQLSFALSWIFFERVVYSYLNTM